MGKTVVGARQRHLHGLVTSRERKSGACSSETWSFEVSAASARSDLQKVYATRPIECRPHSDHLSRAMHVPARHPHAEAGEHTCRLFSAARYARCSSPGSSSVAR